MAAGAPARAQLVPAVHPWSVAVDHTFEDHTAHDESADLDARGVDLSDGSLVDAIFERGRLDDAILVGLLATRGDFDRASFQRADLSGADFTDATFDSADLTDAILTGTMLQRTVFDFAELEGADAGCPLDAMNTCAPADQADLRGVSMRWASATDAVFDDALFRGSASAPTDLSATDFGNASFVRADLTREGTPAATDRFVTLAGAQLRGIDFTCALAAYADMRSVSTQRVTDADPVADLTLADFSYIDLGIGDLADSRISGTKFIGADLTDALLADLVDPCYVEEVDDEDPATPAPVLPVCVTPTPGDGDPSTPIVGQTLCADFTDAVLTRAILAGSDLTNVVGFADNPKMDGVILTSAVVQGVDFSNANLADAVLVDLDPGTPCASGTDCPNFTGAVMTGVNMAGADFKGLQFDFQQVAGKDMNGAVLSGSTVRALTATSTDVADLSGMNLEDVDLSSAIAFGADFSGAMLRGADFSGATLYCSDFSSTELQGARFDGALLCDPGTAGEPPSVCPGTPTPPDTVCATFDMASVAAGSGLSGASFEAVTFPDTQSLASLGLSDLTGTRLDDAIFDGVDLAGVLFTDVSMRDASLVGSVGLAGAGWAGVDLSGAVLHGSDFSGVDLSDATLDGVSLCDSAGVCAQIGAAVLAGSALDPGARMRSVDFRDLADPADLIAPFDSVLKGKDLSYTDLQFANLHDLDLTGTAFVGALLGRADLGGAGLDGADFTDAQLDNTTLTGAVLTSGCSAVFERAVLTGAIWRDARFDLATCVALDRVDPDLRFVDFSYATLSTDTAPLVLTGRDFSRAKMSGVIMTNATLTGNTFESLDMRCRGGDSRCAVLTDSDFSGSGTLMRAADLRGVALDGARFVGTPLQQTRLDGADLEGADLSGAALDQSKLVSASLVSAQLTGATLDAVDASDAIVHDVVFSGLDLRNTTLDRVSLCDTGADGLTITLCADLVGATLAGASGDLGVRMRGVDFSLLGKAAGGPAPFTWARIDTNLSYTDLQLSSFALLAMTNVDMHGADLTGASFAGADVDTVDFGDALLVDANFTGVALPSPCTANFDGARLSGIAWPGVRFDITPCFDFAAVQPDLSGADFSAGTLSTASVPADLSNFDLRGADLRLTEMDSIDLTGARLDGANLASAHIANATLGGANLSDAIVYEVDFAGLDLRGVTLDGVDLCEFDVDDGSLVGVCANFVGAILAGDAMTPGVSMRGVRFGVLADPADTDAPFDWQLKGADLAYADFALASFSLIDGGLDLTGTDFEGAVLEFADLRDTAIDGVDFSGASLRGAVLTGALLPASCTSVFDGVSLRDAIWREANLAGASCFDFTAIDSDLRGVDFTDAVLGSLASTQLIRGFDLSYAILDGADMTGIDFTGTNFDVAELTGAVLAGADLNSATFVDAEFSENGQTLPVSTGSTELQCIPRFGTPPVDLTGADLSKADFSASRHFYPGCIAFDQTTLYSADTLFPPGFPDPPDMTLVPEPGLAVMQASVLATLLWLRRRRSARRR